MMRRTIQYLISLLVGLGAIIAWQPPATAKASEARYVLIVAHNKSLDRGVKSLQFADDDGARYWELFRGTGATVSLLSVLDAETARTHPLAAKAARIPWMRNLVREVDRLGAAIKKDNLAGRRTSFTFIYVGHGNVSKGGEGYVNLQDMRLRRRDFFKVVVDRVPASSIHLIIDACKSFFLLSRGPGDWKDDRSGYTYGEEVRAFLARNTLKAHPHVGAILSTSGDEEVHEWSAFRSGVFSHQLRSALSGAADINGDGKVEYSEVGAFIAAANYKVAHQRVRIRPFLRPPPADRHVALADVSRATGGVVLELASGHRGHISVEDQRGVRRVDLNKSPGRGLRIALVPASYRYFVRRGDEESVIPAGGRRVVRLTSLATRPARARARGSVDSAYHTALFAHPYSRSFYEGFQATSSLPSVSAWITPAPSTSTSGLTLELAYGLSPGILQEAGHDGMQHNITVGLRQDVWRRLFLGLRAEFGSTSIELPTQEESQLRFAVVGSVGLAWRPTAWAEITLQLDAGYQALIISQEQIGVAQPKQASSSSPLGTKLGSAMGLTLRPWTSLPGLGLVFRGGFHGHIARIEGRTTTELLPEASLGVAYSF